MPSAPIRAVHLSGGWALWDPCNSVQGFLVGKGEPVLERSISAVVRDRRLWPMLGSSQENRNSIWKRLFEWNVCCWFLGIISSTSSHAVFFSTNWGQNILSAETAESTFPFFHRQLLPHVTGILYELIPLPLLGINATIPFSAAGKLRNRQFNYLALGHRPCQWQSWDAGSGATCTAAALFLCRVRKYYVSLWCIQIFLTQIAEIAERGIYFKVQHIIRREREVE